MPNHPDLTDLVRYLGRDVSKEKCSTLGLSRKIKEICRRLRKKFPDPTYKIKQTIENLASHASNPNCENIISVLNSPDFKVLLRRKVDTTFYTTLQKREIYCLQLDDFIETVRLEAKNRLIIQNSYVLFSNEFHRKSIQSWARPKSMSLEYNRHLRSSKKVGKSKFNLPTNTVELIELILFNHGYGLMDNHKRIFFYGKFSAPIGRLENLGEMTSYVRLQCDREARPTGRGTRVLIHAYPISQSEVKADLSKSAGSFQMFDLIENSVFNIPLA